MFSNLPEGYNIGGLYKVNKLVRAEKDWRIYEVNQASRLLVSKETLAKKWILGGYLSEGAFAQVMLENETAYCLESNDTYLMDMVEKLFPPNSKVDALAFALSLKETRRIDSDVSLRDAIYVERYSRLLPTWTLLPKLPDDILLGSFLTGGVLVSTNFFGRLSGILSWLSPEDIRDIITAAGLPCVDEGLCMEKKQGQSFTKPDMFLLPGRIHLERFFNDYVVDIIKNPESYRKLGIDFPTPILLYGCPGSGKTYAVEKLAGFLDWPCFQIDSDSIGSIYIHETSKRISQVFRKAIASAPSIIVIDEMEAFLTSRQAAGNNLYHIEEVGEFLKQIATAKDNHVLVIAMTNMLDLIDPAILRKGRFDHIIAVDLPSHEEVDALLHSMLKDVPIDDGIDLSKAAIKLVGRALSDAAYVVREAGRLAAKAGKAKIDQESIDASLASLQEDKDVRRIGF